MKTKFHLLIFAIVILTGCQSKIADKSEIKAGMVKVTIMYPNGEGKTFDMDYYATKHMPMVAELLGESLKSLSVDKGISGRTPDDDIPYVAIGYLYFNKLSDYQESFGPNAQKIVGDIPNYTNIQPIIQISEVFKVPKKSLSDN
ncbi:EthD family reductase [Croceitalea marina]|uniref:EthD family reductase n=1 Tax=Croceitalea marina TaxID=1775166 RepID=A0ABW5MT70_9FLAO